MQGGGAGSTALGITWVSPGRLWEMGFMAPEVVLGFGSREGWAKNSRGTAGRGGLGGTNGSLVPAQPVNGTGTPTPFPVAGQPRPS